MATLWTVSTRGTHRLKDMKLDFVSLVPSGDDPMARVVLAKSDPQGSDLYVPGMGGICATCGRKHKPGTKHSTARTSQEDDMGDQITKDDLDPEVVTYINGLEAEVTTLTDQVQKDSEALAASDARAKELEDTLAKSTPKDDESAEEIRKATLAKADPALRALIEKQDKELAETREIAKAEREARVSKEFVSKAQTMPMLNQDGFDQVLRHAAETLPAEDVEKLDTILKAANAQISQSNLFGAFGVDGGQTTVSKSVEAAAAELRKADPTLTAEQAQVKVYEQNPDLYTAAMKGE